MKKIILHSFTILMILVMGACSSDDDYISSPSEAASQTLSVNDLVENLQASFNNGVTRTQEPLYPDYYGGMYMNKDKQLVILAVGSNSEFHKQDLSRRCNSENFKIQTCNYSFNKLNEGVDKLKNKITSSVIKEFGIKSFYVVEDENQICIGVSDCSQENTSRFKSEVIDLPYISFKEVEKIEHQAEKINAGSPVNSKTGSSLSTLGYRAQYKGEIGFVMAAHATMQMGVVYLNDNTAKQIGQIKTLSQTVDAAFCGLFSKFEASNQTYDFTDLNAQTESVYIGKNVRICGRHSTGSGTVISTNYSFVSEGGNVIYGAIQATYPSKNGDSGAVIYTDNRNIAGMHDAGVRQSSGNTALFILADNINRTLSLNMY